MNKNNFKQKNFLTDTIKYICSIPVKNEGRVLNTIFVSCLFLIIALSIYLYYSLNSIYDYIDSSMKFNSNMNIEYLENTHTDYIEHLINNRIYEYEHQPSNILS